MIPMGNSEMNFWRRIFMEVDEVILCDRWRDPCLHLSPNLINYGAGRQGKSFLVVGMLSTRLGDIPQRQKNDFLEKNVYGFDYVHLTISILFIIGGFCAFLIKANKAMPSRIENKTITLAKPKEAIASTIPVIEL